MSTASPLSAASASDGDAEKRVSASAVRPKATTPTWSPECSAAANDCAAVTAAASGLPLIDSDRSIASTMLLLRPRFLASRPATAVAVLTDTGGGSAERPDDA